MNKVIIEESPQLSRQEIYEFLQDLTAVDKAEVLLVHDKKSLWDIAGDYWEIIDNHDTRAMRLADCGRIIAIGGVTPKNMDSSTVWLLCTDKAANYPMTLYKACKKELGKNIAYSALIYEQNIAHQNFAIRLGFRPYDYIKGFRWFMRICNV